MDKNYDVITFVLKYLYFKEVCLSGYLDLPAVEQQWATKKY